MKILALLLKLVILEPLFFVQINGSPNVVPGNFWQLTDVHWDIRFSATGDPQHMCHESANNKSINSQLDNSTGHFGNYLCDSSWVLVKSAIDSMQTIESKPDFILWTGDNAPHTRDPSPDFKEIFTTTNNITAELRKSFSSNVPIIPVLGNHDTYPKDDYPADNSTFYKTFLDKCGWAPLLDAEAQAEFCHGGYFSTVLPNGLKVLSVNTILYYHPNTLGTNATDPAGQFSWMRNHFEEARTNNQKVLVAAHSPPGFWERNGAQPFFNATYNEEYVNLLSSFSDVVMAQIFGHAHTDSFRIFQNDKGESSAGFLAPSITPWYPSSVPGGTAINPSVRLYSYNASTLIDYHQYHMNLTQANHNSTLWGSCERASDISTCQTSMSDQWQLYYRAKEQFGVEGLTGAQMIAYQQRISQDDKLFQQLYRINSAGVWHAYCDGVCKRNQLCAQMHTRIGPFRKCMTEHVDWSVDLYAIQPRAFTVTIVAAISLTFIISLMLIIVLARRKRLMRSTNLSHLEWPSTHTGYSLLNAQAD